MFEFNFAIENPEADQDKDQIASKTESEAADDEKGTLVDERVVPCGCVSYEEIARKKAAENVQNDIEFQKLSLFTDSQFKFAFENCEPEFESSCVHYVDSYRLNLDEKDLIGQINKTHDVVTGQYEGGLKVWELCIDLARLVFNIDAAVTPETAPTSDSAELNSLRAFFQQACSGKKRSRFSVLELGCGHALPALAVLKLMSRMVRAAKPGEELEITVYLQDFNQQVIENITYQNVKTFLDKEEPLPFKVDFKFVYGDWYQILKKEILPRDSFNLVLTSETIYNSQNYKHLLNLFEACMIKSTMPPKQNPKDSQQETVKKARVDCVDEALLPPSVALLAAKTIYFGCGGNLHDFLNVAKSSRYNFRTSVDILEVFYRDLKTNLQASGNSSNISSESSQPGTSAQLADADDDDVDEEPDVPTISKKVIKLYF